VAGARVAARRTLFTRRSIAALVASAAPFVVGARLARAQGIEGPALIGWYPKYNYGFEDVSVHGAGCLNVPEGMPVGRQAPCGFPTLETLGPGSYAISGENLAPFPAGAEDSGWAAFVMTIGGNAHCFETSTTFEETALRAVVRCVSPESGADVESDFAWSYRADSLEYPQLGGYAPNFAYARVTMDGSLVPEESMNPLDIHDDDVSVRRNGAGDYTVTFADLNPLDGSLEPMLSPYNVVVQKTCSGDEDGGADIGGCYRAVCAASSWTPGDFTTVDTTIDVSCRAADGTPRDTGFRVLVSDEGFTSQHGWAGSFRFAWANWTSDIAAAGCRSYPDLLGTSQHETPESYFPGIPVEACRSDVGRYQVNFSDYITPYSIDAIAPVVSPLSSDGAYCNVDRVECGRAHEICALPDAPETARISVACFDPTGVPTDAPWTLNMTY
jgi:hypothetical protein